MFQLSGKRRVGIQEFAGKKLINIREFYEKDGQMLPSKKVCNLKMVGFSLAIYSYIPNLSISWIADGLIFMCRVYHYL